MPNFTQYMGVPQSAGDPRGPSGIWGDCPVLEFIADPTRGYHIFDDFFNLDEPATGVSASVPEYTDLYHYELELGVTVTNAADSDHGAMLISNLADDNDFAVITHGGNAGWARFGPSDKVWFEIELQKSAVADNGTAIAVGFIEADISELDQVALVDDTAVIDLSQDFVGWRNLQVDGNALEPVFQLGAQTLQHVGTGSRNAQGSGNDTAIVAATDIKLGVKWTGGNIFGGRGAGTLGRIEYFVNGALNSYYDVLSSEGEANSGTVWPDTNHLCMCILAKAGGTADESVTVDWWRGAATSMA